MAFADRPPGDQLVIRYCASHGIPLSVFLGRWTEEDRQVALEWQMHEDGKCLRCGQPTAESMLDIEDAPAYKAELVACHGCLAIAMEENALANEGGDSAGLYSVVRKVS